MEDFREAIQCISSADKQNIEPNLILPERIERGECYEIGETIVVLNHDDYYDLLCKSMENEPKRGEWIHDRLEADGAKLPDLFLPLCQCSECATYVQYESNYCPNCGAKMERSK